jgi:isopenicillin N synthase-like dioxygenase
MILYTPAKSARHIPVIDLEKSFSGNLVDRRIIGWEIHKACRETGFFYVSNHRIGGELMAGQLEWARRFFYQPMEEKLAIDFSHSSRRLGYEPAMKQVLDEGSAPDLKESYMYAAPLTEAGADTDESGVVNLWPERLPGFRAQMLAYHRAIGALAMHVMRCIALSLDLDEEFFDGPFRNTAFGVRLLRYPPQAEIAAGNQLGAGAHTDWGGITVLLQDEKGGLEVLNAEGDWIYAAPIPGTFVVNLGDLLRRWTNDLYKSTTHRVLNNRSGQDRYSVPTFFSPRPDARVACIPSCAAGRPPLYPPITAGEHTAEMARRTYGR